jgi:hypothetical protein
MSTSNPQVAVEKGPSVAADLARGALWLIWQTVRFPVFAFLVILEPIIRLVLTAVAVLGILMSFFFKFAGASPRFPFWGHDWFFGELRPSPDAVLRCHSPAVEVDRRVSISAAWRFARQA